MKFATEAIHSSYDPDDHNRAIMPPIYQNSMFALKEIGENTPFRYARVSNPTRQVLEDTMAALEKGHSGMAFASGMGGIDCIWRTILKPGDTILAVQDIYGGAYDLLVDVYAHWGIQVVFANLTELSQVEPLLQQHKPALVWLESPSNPLLRLVDIQAICTLAHQYGASVGFDNTFATPYLQQPITLGVDVVFHSATKYLCGHSDVTMGIVVVKDAALAKRMRNMQIMTGSIAAPMDCAFVLRGIKTLSVRMDRHLLNAQIIAERLQTHAAVEKVFYPGLPTHEHHALAQTQMNGFGGVVSVYLKNNTREASNQVIKALDMLLMAPSLGGVESLVNHSASQSHSGMSTEVKDALGIREGLLRFSIGIEDVEDIWNDIQQALNATL
ncbi:trans-sulfuration enzyme family protein [Vitreoscilla stercoraria]|uniref:PLP-dependent aspartate aminotransferase family protein n=1 Tax=Vitreoscilla stercoraria TaxID=61 RepID=A0ABY4ECS4_VITST|nr:PLP-dependent aspartate aminotransferase family protein [Vitreoscilla stercoraria]UOO93148.1 PLP-dependent aspartate aminotransferase family protein [Vitreoscilla stercoraria]